MFDNQAPPSRGNGPPGPPQPQGDATDTSPDTVKANGHLHAKPTGRQGASETRR